MPADTSVERSETVGQSVLMAEPRTPPPQPLSRTRESGVVKGRTESVHSASSMANGYVMRSTLE